MVAFTNTNGSQGRAVTPRPTTPGPGGPVNSAWQPQGGVSPFNASAGATGIGEFQRFSDNAYNEAERRLTPQFESQQRGFEQDMVNRGIAPGTPAYDNARNNFDQSRNDAFSGARAQADQLGAAMQQQSFQQGATNSQGLRELLLGQMSADASRYGADQSANASMHSTNMGAQTAANNLGWQREQGDFGNLMQLLGLGQQGVGINNSAIGQDNGALGNWYNMNTRMLGMAPGGQSVQPIDVTSGYNNQYNAGLNQSQINQQQQNANNQMYAQMFNSLWCDRNVKDTGAALDVDAALAAVQSLPLDHWSYKHDGVPHIGTYAQEFNRAIGVPDAPVISVIDMFGAILGSIQALAKRVEAVEAR